jgi:hypothetical protein
MSLVVPRSFGSLVPAVVVVALVCAGCPAGPNNNNPDAGPAADTLNATFDPGFTLTSPNTPGTIEVTLSGEILGENGLPFNPVTAGDPQFVDGWNVSFDKYIVVVGNVQLSPNATQSAIWQQTSGVVAHKDGPFVVDVHRLATSGANGFVGKDGEEPAGALFKFDAQDNGTLFDTGTLYAFSYDTIVAKYPATQVNLSQEEFAIYDEMVKNGWDKYIEATATYVGTGTIPSAQDPDGSIQQHFAALPPVVHFKLGWSDATHYQNCINPDNGNGDAEDLANRGVQPNSNGAVIAQITAHTDHLFWDKLKQEGTPLRMDPVAAWADASGHVDIDDLASKPLAVTFSDGTPMPDRAPFQNVPGGYTTDQANPAQIVLDLGGVTSSGIGGLADFMAFSAQSQMHLNSDGLCYVVGQSAADPFYVPNVQPAK